MKTNAGNISFQNSTKEELALAKIHHLQATADFSFHSYYLATDPTKFASCHAEQAQAMVH